MTNTPGETSNPTAVHMYSPFLAGSPDLKRAEQAAMAARLLACTADLDRAAQALMLKSRLTATQAAALAQFTRVAIESASDIDRDGNALAMRALLEPHNPLHPLQARCLNAKARAVEFGLRQFSASVSTCTGSFDELVADMRALLEACHRAHARNAGALTHELVGGDPTDATYLETRTEAAISQGGAEAYDDLLEWFDSAIAAGVTSAHSEVRAHG